MENVVLIVVLKKDLPTQEACEVINWIKDIPGVLKVKTMEAVVAGAFPELEVLEPR